MLGCCHCLCSKEYDAQTRVRSCYPSDRRPEPVAACVRELISWGSHDLSRFDSIDSIIADRTRQDIFRKRVNDAAVGVKILWKLVERVPELNSTLCKALQEIIVVLIDTKSDEFLTLALESTHVFLRHAARVNISENARKIVRKYVELSKESAFRARAFQALADILRNAVLEYLNLGEVLEAIKTDFKEKKEDAVNVMSSIVSAIQPLNVVSFCESFFEFVRKNNTWAEPDFKAMIFQLFKDVNEECAPALFRLWLEQLPPKGSEIEHAGVIVSITEEIMQDETLRNRVLVTTMVDPLITIAMFAIKVPSLNLKDEKEFLERTVKLGGEIANYFAQSDILVVAQRQIWDLLPGGEDKSVDFDKNNALIVFQFVNAMNEAMKESGKEKATRREMNFSSLKRIKSFLAAFDNYPAEVLAATFEHLRRMGKAFPASCVDNIIPCMLALQSEIEEKKKKSWISIHSFIMAVMSVAVEGETKEAQEYVAEVAKTRITSKARMVDFSLDFVCERFPKAKDAKKEAKEAKVSRKMELFDQDKLIAKLKKDKAEFAKRVGDFTKGTKGKGTHPEAASDDNDRLTIKPGSTASNKNPEHQETNREEALSAIKGLKFVWNSSLGGVLDAGAEIQEKQPEAKPAEGPKKGKKLPESEKQTEPKKEEKKPEPTKEVKKPEPKKEEKKPEPKQEEKPAEPKKEEKKPEPKKEEKKPEPKQEESKEKSPEPKKEEKKPEPKEEEKSSESESDSGSGSELSDVESDKSSSTETESESESEDSNSYSTSS